jgi:sugar lactone lactonase YvrE
VSDSNNGRVAIFAPDGSVLAQINRGAAEGELSMPRGMAIDDEARLYVVDAINQQVQIYDLRGLSSAGPKYLATIGAEGIGDGQFEFPNGIAADSRGRVYITDRVNNRVQIWSY